MVLRNVLFYLLHLAITNITSVQKSMSVHIIIVKFVIRQSLLIELNFNVSNCQISPQEKLFERIKIRKTSSETSKESRFGENYKKKIMPRRKINY